MCIVFIEKICDFIVYDRLKILHGTYLLPELVVNLIKSYRTPLSKTIVAKTNDNKLREVEASSASCALVQPKKILSQQVNIFNIEIFYFM